SISMGAYSAPVWNFPGERESTVTGNRFPRHPFDGSFESERLFLLRGLTTRIFIGIVLGLVPLAYASPPDPTWIPGVYDDDDYADVVGVVTDGTGASGSEAPAGVGRNPAAFVQLSEPGLAPYGTQGAQMSRGPPVLGASVGSISSKTPPRCRSISFAKSAG